MGAAAHKPSGCDGSTYGVSRSAPCACELALRGGLGTLRRSVGVKGMPRDTPLNTRLATFRRMSQKAGALHPLWIYGGPLVQLPVFVTLSLSLRALSTMNPMPLDLVRPPQLFQSHASHALDSSLDRRSVV